MFDPSSFNLNNKEKFLILFESKYLPAIDICSINEYITLLKHLKLKQFYDIKCDELIDICELTIKESTTNNKRSLMFLLADFIIDIINQNPKLIDDYSQTKRISLKQYLNITQWMPVMLERPHTYPSTLTWQGKEPIHSSGVIEDIPIGIINQICIDFPQASIRTKTAS
jgi:hypothetical protein